MKKIFLIFLLAATTPFANLPAQEEESDEEVLISAGSGRSKPAQDRSKKSFVRIINAVRAQTDPVWQSGLDMVWRNQVLANDIRSGEGASYSELEFDGQSPLQVSRNSNGESLFSQVVKFEPRSFHTIILYGEISNTKADLKAAALSEEMLENNPTASVFFFNTINFFPLRVQIEGLGNLPASPGQWTPVNLRPGTHLLEIQFPDEKGVAQKTQQQLVIEPGSRYLIVLSPNPHRKAYHRPRVLILDEKEARQNVLEMELYEDGEEESDQVPPEEGPSPSPASPSPSAT